MSGPERTMAEAIMDHQAEAFAQDPYAAGTALYPNVGRPYRSRISVGISNEVLLYRSGKVELRSMIQPTVNCIGAAALYCESDGSDTKISRLFPSRRKIPPRFPVALPRLVRVPVCWVVRSRSPAPHVLVVRSLPPSTRQSN
jgi:hypothetical protein